MSRILLRCNRLRANYLHIMLDDHDETNLLFVKFLSRLESTHTGVDSKVSPRNQVQAYLFIHVSLSKVQCIHGFNERELNTNALKLVNYDIMCNYVLH